MKRSRNISAALAVAFVLALSPFAAFADTTNDGVEIEYDYDGENGIDIPLHVEKQGKSKL